MRTSVATGSRPTTSPTPGATLAHVETATDYLARMPAGASPSATGPAVVIGASWIGCHAADALAAQGYSVTVIDTHDSLGYDMGLQQGMVLRDRVSDTCALRLKTSVERIEPDRVLVWDSVSGESTDIAAKRVVIASRMESSRSLADALRGHTAARVHVIGDAVAPRKLADALLEGARVGHWL